MGLSPLMDALEIPRFLDGHGFEPQPVEAAVDEMGESGSRVFDALCIGGAGRGLRVVAPSRHPVPLAGGVPVVEPHLDDRPGGSGLFESGKEAVSAVFVGFDLDDHMEPQMAYAL